MGYPTRGFTVVYLVAIGGALYLLYRFLKTRREWKGYLAREDLGIFTALGFGATLCLAQCTYNGTYWAVSWPFAVAMVCLLARRLVERYPGKERVAVGAVAVVVALNMAYLPGHIYLWDKGGFVNMRSQLRDFANSLPQGKRLFIPEVLWHTYADKPGNVFLNTLPFAAGEPMEESYAAYIGARIRSGDVLVVNLYQHSPTLIDPHQPGWKEIAKCRFLYTGAVKHHGYDLTAYQKE
jgi:hypothetical protein